MRLQFLNHHLAGLARKAIHTEVHFKEFLVKKIVWLLIEDNDFPFQLVVYDGDREVISIRLPLGEALALHSHIGASVRALYHRLDQRGFEVIQPERDDRHQHPVGAV